MFIRSGEAELFAVDFGRGERAILALGGWAGSWELWSLPFGRLSQSWRAIAYDHRGAGVTIAPLESITVDNMVADVFAVMDATGLDSCVLAAESAGATVALLAALERPDRFDGLVLVDGLIQHPANVSDNMFLRAVMTDFEATIRDFARQCAPAPEDHAIRHWGVQILRRGGQDAAVRLLECMAGIDLWPRVGEINLPTLVIHGAADTIVPIAEGQWLADRLPNGRLQVVPGAGHVPTMTHPDQVAELIDAAFTESWVAR